jgi:hypothetical protein
MVFPQCPTVKRSARNSGAAIAGRVCYTTASSAAALGHLGAAHKHGSGAKMARSREEFGSSVTRQELTARRTGFFIRAPHRANIEG